MPKSTPVPLVVPAREMSDEHLLLHINGRHADCWHGTAPLTPRVAPDALRRGEPFTLHKRGLWDILHERLHRGESWGEHGHHHGV